MYSMNTGISEENVVSFCGKIRGGSGKVQGMEEGDGEKRAEGEHGKDKGRNIWRATDDKNGEWEYGLIKS